MKLVIFDLDGTLVRFPHDYLISEAVRINAELGHPAVPAKEIHEAFEAFDFFRFVTGGFDQKEYTELFWEHFNWTHFPKPTLFPHTLDVLEQIRAAGLTMGIATARLTPVPELVEELRPTSIESFMSCVETRDSAETDWKDKSGQITRVCEQLAIAPREAVIVGDIPPDVLSGRAVGIGLTVAVSSGGIRRDILEGSRPDYLFDDISGLLALLPEWSLPR